eukprot:3919904-Rhodomonas_salina.6
MLRQQPSAPNTPPLASAFEIACRQRWISEEEERQGCEMLQGPVSDVEVADVDSGSQLTRHADPEAVRSTAILLFATPAPKNADAPPFSFGATVVMLGGLALSKAWRDSKIWYGGALTSGTGAGTPDTASCLAHLA